MANPSASPVPSPRPSPRGGRRQLESSAPVPCPRCGFPRWYSPNRRGPCNCGELPSAWAVYSPRPGPAPFGGDGESRTLWELVGLYDTLGDLTAPAGVPTGRERAHAHAIADRAERHAAADPLAPLACRVVRLDGISLVLARRLLATRDSRALSCAKCRARAGEPCQGLYASGAAASAARLAMPCARQQAREGAQS